MGAKMQGSGRFIVNKMALVFIAIIVLELVLIGHQVQPLKSIKKKLLFKKLKKILPLLALIKKPKKKLILVPIPIPMFNKPMDMPMMDAMDMPMNYQQESYTNSGSGGGGDYSQESNQEKGNASGY